MNMDLPELRSVSLGMGDVENSLEKARAFAKCYAPQADVVLLAGSRGRGSSSERSDYDIVLLYSSLPDGAWREMVRCEEHDFEVFAHDLGTLAYFFEEIDRPSRKPVLIRMVLEGKPAIVRDEALLKAAKDMAESVYAGGPPVSDDLTLRLQRYAVTDMAEALREQPFSGRILATGATLYSALAALALRAGGQWGADGKAVPSALEALSPDLNERFTQAFVELFNAKGDAAVQNLVDFVLSPLGGRLRSGFRQSAPSNWRQ